ncbi:hypothetical protein [Acinetobacter radioresistens]|uniref:hypothetical protein n=1 Tax=Acinetobacter radioresistens TaxID=40216 RepID=UPI0012505BE9|nr:hypothetical protein [Acinetobacter radioresistens]
MDIQSETNNFDAFVRDKFPTLVTNKENGNYFATSMYESMLAAWQAAKAQAVPEENALLSATLDAVQKLGSGEFVLVEREKLAMIFETATNALVYHAAPPKHDALSIIQGIARKAMIEAQEQGHE